ncbi:hypothetical protein MUG84_06110 [Paenibacillus sp. KQZ6P-2]|uniref:Uncharacterized protein n=1 Tax=Paenibacillus mangrovi TaxID=2931978 RepID=A0A9X1WPI2_9BACL|nr:hypothetical protein [Paenibacillus mangrovi]MCJ8011323.1 hypothetical protein [Paenibacillus mangrovi]
MPRKMWFLVLGCCLMVMLAGCSNQSDADKDLSSPVMKDVYSQSVPGDAYSKGQISPP